MTTPKGTKMTDQTIPADKVRAARDLHRDAAKMVTITDTEREIHQHVADAMEALLPTPTLPTLADLPEEERRACRWMQADVEGYEHRPVIITPHWVGGDVRVMCPDGSINPIDPGHVTPRTDLPRMEWPSDKKPAPTPALPDGWRLAEHQTLGRVIVTSASTSSDGDGYVYILLPTDDSRGYDWMFCPTNRLTYLDQ